MDISEHDSSLPPNLIDAYRAARYRVDAVTGTFVLGVDRFSPALEALMRLEDCSSVAFLTAWNPLGADLPLAVNEIRQVQMLKELAAAGFSSIEGFGSDPTGQWPGEASRLVLGMSRQQACEFGERQQQNAVLWSGADAVPRLLLLRWKPGRAQKLGRVGSAP